MVKKFKDIESDIRYATWEAQRIIDSLYEYIYDRKINKVENVNTLGVRLKVISEEIIKLTSI